MSREMTTIMSEEYIHQVFEVTYTLEPPLGITSGIRNAIYVSPWFWPFNKLDCCFQFRFSAPTLENNNGCATCKLNGLLVTSSNAALREDVALKFSLEARCDIIGFTYLYKYELSGFQNVHSMPKINRFTMDEQLGTLPVHIMPISLDVKCLMFFTGHLPEISRLLEKQKSLSYLEGFKGSFVEIYDKKLFCDYEVIVADKVFPVHKCVLAAHSEVFSKNLKVEVFEKSYRIDNFTPEIVDSFLKYLYSSDLEENTLDCLKELFLIAREFHVVPLQDICEEQIIRSHLTLPNICDMLKFAYDHDLTELKTVATHFAAINSEILKFNTEYKKLIRNNLEMHLKIIRDHNSLFQMINYKSSV